MIKYKYKYTIMKTTKSKTSKSVMPTSVTVKGKTIKPSYNVSEITSRTNGNLWVTFVAGQPKSGLVFSMVLTRDEARNAASKMFGTSITSVRSQRVSTYRKNSSK
jgi:hypothetical protein